MRAYLSRRYHFSASHRLHAASLDEEQNRKTYGKCNHPHGHGHNYVVTVTVCGPVDAATGMVANLGDLDAFAKEHLLDHYDVANLNRLRAFERQVPTTENLAVELYGIFRAFPHGELNGIHVEETGNNSFDYTGGELPRPGRF